MLKPDQYFNRNSQYFLPKNRHKARIAFRRAIRDYYVMQRKYVFEPLSGRRVKHVFYGEIIKVEKNQRRLVDRVFTGHKSAGRPTRPEIPRLISRLFILWQEYASSEATVSWKLKTAVPTEFEEFLKTLLPRLGAPDVRRYVEAHWKGRK